MTTITTLPGRTAERPGAVRPGIPRPGIPRHEIPRPGIPRPVMRRGWSRMRPLLIAALPVALLAVALGCALGAGRIVRDNSLIRSLAAGRDVAVPVEAAAPLLLARVQHLARRGGVEAIEPLIEALDRRGEVDRAARARYALANAHLRQAFDHLERGDLDPAGPRITLARQEYRRALQGRPDFWDAKFNLDVASRLLRDFPDFDRKSGDALAAEPKKIWTDIPGQPRGEP